MEIRPRVRAGEIAASLLKGKAAEKPAPPSDRLNLTPCAEGASVAGPAADVRAEEIARARRLVADPDYPPPKVLKNVARLLAQHLSPGPQRKSS